MPLFQIILSLTLLVLLVVINRLYHGLRILNSRVDILSNLVKNLREQVTSDNASPDETIQEYLEDEQQLRSQLSRDFSYRLKKTNRQYTGQSLMRSKSPEAEATTTPPPPSRFKRHVAPQTPVPATRSPAPAPLAPPVHTLSAPPESHSTPAPSTVAPPTFHDTTHPQTGESQAQDETTAVSAAASERTSAESKIPISAHHGLGHTPTSVEPLTLQEVTQHKLPPPPADLARSSEETTRLDASSISTTSSSALQAPTDQQEPQEDAEHNETLQTTLPSEMTELGRSPSNGDADADAARSEDTRLTPRPHLNQDDASEEDTKLTPNPLSASTEADRNSEAPAPSSTPKQEERPTGLAALGRDTALSLPPTPGIQDSPSQEDLLSSYQVDKDGPEVQIKKDLSYVTRPSQRKKSLSVEQIPSLSLLREQKNEGKPDLDKLLFPDELTEPKGK